MITAADLHGIMAMMPAFTTDDGDDVRATDTIDVDRLRDGVDRIIKDGANAIATTGSFGEFSNLLPAEFETLVHATVEVVAKRVPVIIGCTSLHTREAMQKMEFIRDAGADAVIVGVPYYFPSTVANAVRFYHDVADMFPTLGVLIYHNPTLHHVTLPVDAFREIIKSPNVIGMKDSHRFPAAFMQLMNIVRGRISVFVHQAQYYPYAELGAAGFWSIDAWMGLEPLVFLRDAVDRGDIEAAKEAIADTMFKRGDPTALHWREPGHKIAVRYAGYCDPGPLRPPFLEIPEDVLDRQKARAEHWRSICEKYGSTGGAIAAG
ncbi:MAG: dihydrodipicolinate synthase family protein [Alphaproteobacteria bacterium]|nr:dihydrodipicolinate synthase family protein [Alphaproteobacteria bacterium]